MSTPELHIDLDKIFHNASSLVFSLKSKGVAVTGVTKAFLGAPQIARTLLRAGVSSLGDSRIENIERMRRSGILEQIMLIRSPMISQVDRVVASADISLNTEIDVVAALSIAARSAGKTHGVVLMVELGDLREGIMPEHVGAAVRTVCAMPNIRFMGLGTNLACRSGVSPDDRNMAELSELASRVAQTEQCDPFMVSGGNSSNLKWLLSGGKVGHINNLRLGEAILLGREALKRTSIDGLFTDAVTLTAEVIESKVKPTKPWGNIAQSAFANQPVFQDLGNINQAIIAIGRQDIDPEGLQPPTGMQVLDASSDHLMLNTGARKLAIGSQVSFQPDYSALLRAMTSPHVIKTFNKVATISRVHSNLDDLPDAA